MKLLLLVFFMLSLQTAEAQWRPQFERKLKELQSGQTAEIGYKVYDIAMTWAAAGHIRPANELLARFWRAGIGDLTTNPNLHGGIQVLWAVSGQRPDTIPFALRPVNEIVQENWDVAFNPAQWAWEARQSIVNKSWKELSGADLDIKAVLLCYDGHGHGHRSDPEQRREALQAFMTALAADTGAAGHSTPLSSPHAAIVAASLGENQLARRFIRHFGTPYLERSSFFTLQTLMMDTATARLLLEGVLQPVWGLTAEECERELKEVETVLDAHLRKGPSLVYGQLTMRELLERISKHAIKSPATETAISVAEKRLGVKLPEDYKEFLRLTNGFDAVGSIEPSFLSVENISLLRDKMPVLVSIWGDSSPTDDAEQAAGFKRSILIGGEREEQQFLLVPPGGKHTEWQYWFFANWVPGIKPQLSLRFYLESILLRMEQ